MNAKLHKLNPSGVAFELAQTETLGFDPPPASLNCQSRPRFLPSGSQTHLRHPGNIIALADFSRV